MGALFIRDLTGEAERVDHYDRQATVNNSKIEMAAYITSESPSAACVGKPSGWSLASRDGYVYTLWAADTHYQALKTLLGNPEGLDTELFDTLAGRHENDDVLRPIIRDELLKHDMEYLVREGQRLGLTIGPVHTVTQAANHPHLAARDAFVEIDHPVAGRFKYPHRMVSMTETPPVPTRAPLLGEHNDEILESLGISRDRRQALLAEGAI